MRVVTVGVATGLGLCGVVAGARQTTGPRNPALVIPSMAGQDLFTFYCATCHGLDAKGNGPIAAALKVPPADLTQLRRRNRGGFPRERLIGFIAGGGPTLNGAHGSNEMPVWGPIFMALDPSDRMTTIRIENVVQYLESIQVK
jgi:mono/diheme cytochrome c family protein